RLRGRLAPNDKGQLREAVLGGLGSWNHSPDGRLPAQIYCALEEIFRDNPSRLFDFATASPATVRYELRRWGNAAGAAVADGTLADLRPDRQFPAGLYLLALDLPTAAGTSFRQAE